MATHPLLQVDAFTDRRLHGNPCAVVLDADDLDDATMQAIAREMNLSETAFVRRSSRADFAARYFTTTEEIPLAGHPTLATTWALIETGRFKLTGAVTTLTLELQVGPIRVDIHSDGESGRGAIMTMTQKKPLFLARHDPAAVLPVFGLTPADLLPGVPIQTVSTGTPQLMVALGSHAALARIRFNPAAYAELRARGDFFSPHLFALGGATAAGHTFARHFGEMEDPFTGSATGGMAAYLWRYSLVDTPTFVAEQGHWMQRPGEAYVEVVGPREDIESVKVGGRAVTVVTGSLLV